MIRETEKAIVEASHIYPAYQQKPYLDGGIFGYNLAVDKAVEFLKDKSFGDWIESEADELINDFREAMKGD